MAVTITVIERKRSAGSVRPLNKERKKPEGQLNSIMRHRNVNTVRTCEDRRSNGVSINVNSN